eukprot:s4368_g2.t2
MAPFARLPRPAFDAQPDGAFAADDHCSWCSVSWLQLFVVGGSETILFGVEKFAGLASAALWPWNREVRDAIRDTLQMWMGGGVVEKDSCPMPNGVVEERHVDSLEVLLAEEHCPFVAAFFSSSSPLSQTSELALTEQRLATSFPTLRYVRVETEYMTIRSFLQWDISFLPTYVLFWPGHASLGGSETKGWHRWMGKGANPYDYSEVSSWISDVTGLLPQNTSDVVSPVLLPRGSSQKASSLAWLGIAWTLVALAVLHRTLNWQPIFGR